MTRIRLLLLLAVALLLLYWFNRHERAPNFEQMGKASYYATFFDGKKTANGEIFANDSLTAAHKYLPMNTRVKVTNLQNGKSVIVRINDRGPYVGKRIIDLSQAAADSLGFMDEGLAEVALEAYVSQYVADSLEAVIGDRYSQQ